MEAEAGFPSIASFNGEKLFWRTRLFIIIGLSIVMVFCSFFMSGNLNSKLHHVDKLLHPDSTENIIYTNNPEIEVYVDKLKVFVYVDIALKSVLLVVCIALIVVVFYALKTHQLEREEHEGLLDQPASSDSINMNLSDVNNEVIKEGVVYEAYTEHTLTTLADDEATPAFNKVSAALYKHGPLAAQQVLTKLESQLTQEEIQYLLKTLSERK